MSNEAVDDLERILQAVKHADSGLARKRATWETPRRIAILVIVVAAAVGVLGFKMGQGEIPQTIIIQQPAPVSR